MELPKIKLKSKKKDRDTSETLMIVIYKIRQVIKSSIIKAESLVRIAQKIMRVKGKQTKEAYFSVIKK